jgi:hypothetical protein
MNILQLAIGYGAMGFWAEMDGIFPQTRQQSCWEHKTANILNSLHKKPHRPKQKRPYIKSGRQRLKSMQRKPLSSSFKPIRINIQRPPFLFRKILKSYWPVMIFLPDTEKLSRPGTRLNLPLVLTGTEPLNQRVVSIFYVAHDV